MRDPRDPQNLARARRPRARLRRARARTRRAPPPFVHACVHACVRCGRLRRSPARACARHQWLPLSSDRLSIPTAWRAGAGGGGAEAAGGDEDMNEAGYASEEKGASAAGAAGAAGAGRLP